MTDAIIDAEFIAKRLETARAGPPRLRELCAHLDADSARWKPGVGKLSVLEHVCHMLEMERAVFGLRLRRILDEDEPTLAPVNEEHYVEEAKLQNRTVTEVTDAWAIARQDNVDLVASTTSDQWSRPVNHPDLGRATFADVVDRWSRHDMDHLRQIEIIALNAEERP